jgi:hypothetical protein
MVQEDIASVKTCGSLTSNSQPFQSSPRESLCGASAVFTGMAKATWKEVIWKGFSKRTRKVAGNGANLWDKS